MVPRKPLNFFIVVGFGNSIISVTRSASGFMPVSVIEHPRKETSLSPRCALDTLIVKPFLRRRWNTIRRCSARCSSLSDAMSMSLMYLRVNTQSRVISLRNLWKICVAFCKPNTINTNSNNPNSAMIAVFGIFIWINWDLI